MYDCKTKHSNTFLNYKKKYYIINIVMKKIKKITLLTNKNFEKKIDKSNIWLIKFYSPICGPCQRFIPEFKKVANKLSKKTKEIRCGKINCLRYTKLSKKFKIRYYPCVKIIIPNKKKMITHKGLNNNIKIYKFALKIINKYSDKK